MSGVSRAKFIRTAALAMSACFVMGAGMEFFMIKTGFYQIVTNKEAERRHEKIVVEEERMKRLRAMEERKRILEHVEEFDEETQAAIARAEMLKKR
mmetsp:Transcript_12192/g.32810  ORF Transcript_12192/g.32810 Transcript_12192/m.32810 type:complete len:96 (+) Transcript_12192:78-365(+)